MGTATVAVEGRLVLFLEYEKWYNKTNFSNALKELVLFGSFFRETADGASR